MRDVIDPHDAADRGEQDANPHRPGTRDYYDWSDEYKDARRDAGRDYRDGPPAGNPAWG